MEGKPRADAYRIKGDRTVGIMRAAGQNVKSDRMTHHCLHTDGTQTVLIPV